MSSLYPWLIDEESIEQALGRDPEEVLEFLQEARDIVDKTYPRRGDLQTNRIRLLNYAHWSSMHWLMFSLTRQVEQDE